MSKFEKDLHNIIDTAQDMQAIPADQIHPADLASMISDLAAAVLLLHNTIRAKTGD